jgi:putative protease
MERLRMAVAYGADAVYLAGGLFGMRSFAGNFSPEELQEAVALCRGRGVKVHVTCNTIPRNGELALLPQWLEYLEELGVDAAIVADVGVLSLLKQHAPHVAAHISTQASVVNYQAARAWHELGASRIVLARELSLDEIREIRAKTPPALELEAFAHGSMCVSYSGRCLLSNYMTGRDANRGACAQPCRYQYALMEEKRPGEYFPVYEENGETYIMNSRDMCMIDHIPELLDAGLDSLKIEGRAKSMYYAAVITGAYRHAVDAALAGDPLDPVWRGEVERVSHRHYSTGFYFGEPGQFTQDARYIRDWQVSAMVEACDGEGNAVLSLNNKFSTGDELELVGPGVRPMAFTAPALAGLEGNALTEVRRPEMRFAMRLPRPVPPLSILRRGVELTPRS